MLLEWFLLSAGLLRGGLRHMGLHGVKAAAPGTSQGQSSPPEAAKWCRGVIGMSGGAEIPVGAWEGGKTPRYRCRSYGNEVILKLEFSIFL